MSYEPPVPDPLFGEHLTKITVCKLKRQDGAWVLDGTPESLLAYVNATEHEHDTGARDVRPVTQVLANFVPRQEGERLRIQCLARSEDMNIMHRMWDESTNRRFQVDWVEGEEACTGRFSGGTKRGGIVTRDENVVEWNLLPMNDGSGNRSNVSRTRLTS